MWTLLTGFICFVAALVDQLYKLLVLLRELRQWRERKRAGLDPPKHSKIDPD